MVFCKYEDVYDEYYDCCLCPKTPMLSYHTTNRKDYREYRSCREICTNCQISITVQKAKSCKSSHVSCVAYMEKAEDICHIFGKQRDLCIEEGNN